MNFQSGFFKTLKEENWWWITQALQSSDPRLREQKEQFDSIAHAIEISSCHNKRILHTKLQKIISHIVPSRTGPLLSCGLQQMSLDEFCNNNSNAKNNLEHYYAEETNYISILSEMKVFSELSRMGLREIQFLEETPKRKTPDFKALENSQNIFVEVKFISPPKKEEQGMMARVVDFVEENQNCWDNVRNKLLCHLEDAKAKFEAVGAYAQDCKRWVYVYIIWGSDAKYKNHENWINSLICELEKKFGIELKFFKTF